MVDASTGGTPSWAPKSFTTIARASEARPRASSQRGDSGTVLRTNSTPTATTAPNQNTVRHAPIGR